MLGYSVNIGVDVIISTLFHHQGIVFDRIALGNIYLGSFAFLVGIILFSPLNLRRTLGYGLKFSNIFKHTHLGSIGKE